MRRGSGKDAVQQECIVLSKLRHHSLPYHLPVRPAVETYNQRCWRCPMVQEPQLGVMQWFRNTGYNYRTQREVARNRKIVLPMNRFSGRYNRIGILTLHFAPLTITTAGATGITLAMRVSPGRFAQGEIQDCLPWCDAFCMACSRAEIWNEISESPQWPSMVVRMEQDSSKKTGG